MPSLQLLPLTEHRRSILASRRRTLALVSGVLVAGGTVAYMQSRWHSRPSRPGSSANLSTLGENKEGLSQNGVDDKSIRTVRRKKRGLRSLHVLASILLSQMGPMGMRNLMALVATAALRTALSNRLAKVQGFLFRAAFLRRVPTFLRLIAENILLCFLQSSLFSTSKYLTGALSLRFRKILTELIHADYFEAYVLGAGSMIRNFSPAFGKLMSKEQQLEGDYRQLHSRLRTHAESVAFYEGEKREAFHIKQQFKILIKHLNLVLHDNWWFGMIQDFLVKYLGATVAVVLIIEPFFTGNLRPDTSTIGRAKC